MVGARARVVLTVTIGAEQEGNLGPDRFAMQIEDGVGARAQTV